MRCADGGEFPITLADAQASLELVTAWYRSRAHRFGGDTAARRRSSRPRLLAVPTPSHDPRPRSRSVPSPSLSRFA